jgi:alpha-tubulin suppressor-like RCC1 family protein
VTTCQFLYHPGLLDLKASVVQVACGKAHLILLTADEDVYSVGAGRDAQLGHGKRTDVVTARLILKGKKIFHVAAGRCHHAPSTGYNRPIRRI